MLICNPHPSFITNYINRYSAQGNEEGGAVVREVREVRDCYKVISLIKFLKFTKLPILLKLAFAALPSQQSDYKVCSFRRTQFEKAQLAHPPPKKIVAIKDEMQGPRSSRNRTQIQE